MMLGCLLGQPLAFVSEAASGPKIGWWVVARLDGSGITAVEHSARKTMEELAARQIGTEELKSLLKQSDEQQDVLGQAGKLLARGKESALGLKLKQAVEFYQQAIHRLEHGFVRYYAPGRLAEPLLHLGMVLYQSNQKDQAIETFQRALRLVPGLELSRGYFSPSVRRGFEQAREKLGRPEPDVPAPSELGRICEVAGLRGMVVVSWEQLGDRPVFRLAWFDAGIGRFSAVETVVIEEKQAETNGQKIARQLGKTVASSLGLSWGPRIKTAGLGLHKAKEAKEGQEASEPWYLKHWWIWPVTVAVIGVAVALPLTVFRKDVVDVWVRY